MKKATLLIIIIIICSCGQDKTTAFKKENTVKGKYSNKTNKIQVLNFGTFHMGFTPDANTTKFNEHDKKNQEKARDVARMLTKFKPTVIIVEENPENNEKLQNSYKKYLKTPAMFFEEPSELELIAFELGRLSSAKRIYGINNVMHHKYWIADYMVGKNTIDSTTTINHFRENPFLDKPEMNIEKNNLSLLKRLKLLNKDKFFRLSDNNKCGYYYSFWHEG